jgi:Cu(I)/Ag(I) efflux system membrane protein CusA/SilA
MSLAVWVGMIALAGLDAETGVIMLLYLEKAFENAKKQGAMKTLVDLRKQSIRARSSACARK